MEYAVRPQHHTPGPWRVAQSATDTPDAPGTEQKAVVVDEHNFVVVSLEKRDSAARDNANAALIAAAPDLLAKCQKIAAWLDRLADRAESEAKDTRFESLAEAYAADAKNYRATASDVRTVIAKATGSAL